MRKIVSFKHTSLERRLGRACCVVFVSDYCEKCTKAVDILEEKMENDGGTVTVVRINDVEQRIQDELSVYGSPPLIFIGNRNIKFEDLKNYSDKEFKQLTTDIEECIKSKTDARWRSAPRSS